METENKRRITTILDNARTQLEYVNVSVRSDILEIVRALSIITGKSQVSLYKELKQYIDLHITINETYKPQVKRGRGRPRKEVK